MNSRCMRSSLRTIEYKPIRMTGMQIRKAIEFATVVLCIVLAGCAGTVSQNYQLGVDALDKGNYDEAIENFNAHLKNKSKDADAYLKRGLAFLKKGSLEEAVASFKKSIALNQNNSESLSMIKKSIMEEVNVFLSEGKNDVAMRYLTAHLTINPDDVDTHIILTREFIKMGSRNNALMSLNKAVSLDPKNPEVIELLDYFSGGFH
jgi:tetratricopeptide (TPR) repeat protein